MQSTLGIADGGNSVWPSIEMTIKRVLGGPEGRHDLDSETCLWGGSRLRGRVRKKGGTETLPR